jgi:hypothetical protein
MGAFTDQTSRWSPVRGEISVPADLRRGFRDDVVLEDVNLTNAFLFGGKAGCSSTDVLGAAQPAEISVQVRRRPWARSSPAQ